MTPAGRSVFKTTLSATPACPGGQTGTSHARRSVAREGTARRARGPPVRYRDKPVPMPVRGPFSMPIRGPDCLPFDRCESAWNKDPVFGVIGIQSGPPERRVHSGFHGGYGGQVGDVGSGDNREDPSGVFRPEQADQDDLPRVSGVAKGRAQGDPVAGDRVSL